VRLLVRRAKRPHDQAMTGEGITDQGGGPEAQRDARRGVPALSLVQPSTSRAQVDSGFTVTRACCRLGRHRGVGSGCPRSQCQGAGGRPRAAQRRTSSARQTLPIRRTASGRGKSSRRDALTEAVFAADLVRDHREQATRYAAQRARAVMRANQHGVSYRQIAEALSVSIGMFQQWMRAALRLDEGQS